jgi:hypothetical protein
MPNVDLISVPLVTTGDLHFPLCAEEIGNFKKGNIQL